MTNQLPPLLLAGCGKMGGAMLRGWIADGLAPSVILDRWVDDIPAPHFVARTPDDIAADFKAAVIVLAAKPQKADLLIEAVAPFAGADTVFLSVMAGRTVAGLQAAFARVRPDAPLPTFVRSMPNTPSAIGQGMTVAFAPPTITSQQRTLCTRLLEAVGVADWVDDEALIDAVTAVSGSGPAYLFLVAELLEHEGIAQGLPPALARTLARQTVSGSGALLAATTTDAAELRRQVTSPNGTTQAALEVLMAPDALPDAFARAIDAARRRAAELAG